MNQLVRTIKNCWKLKSVSLFSVLYNEVDIDVIVRKNHNWESSACFSFDPANMYIRISSEFNKLVKNTALLHEIGHYIDFKRVKTPEKFRKISTTQKEKNAWKYCFRLSDRYNLPLDLATAKRWLASYETNYRVLDNRIANES